MSNGGGESVFTVLIVAGVVGGVTGLFFASPLAALFAIILVTWLYMLDS